MVPEIDDPNAATDRLAPRSDPPRVIVLSSSPRRNGNSRRLAEAVLAGAAEAGHAAELAHLPDHLSGFLRDCRECRDAEGRCSIDDGFRALFLDKVLAADAIVYATPIWWYGISGILKTFMDRMFCYIAHSEADSEDIARRLQWKRAALVLSAEESNFSARLAIVQQMQELCRYLNHSMVGIVTGIGNRRGDVDQDPNLPLDAARDLGRRIFEIEVTDYHLDTPRAASVWQGEQPFPGYWR